MKKCFIRETITGFLKQETKKKFPEKLRLGWGGDREGDVDKSLYCRRTIYCFTLGNKNG